jgi:hypothetical protein
MNQHTLHDEVVSLNMEQMNIEGIDLGALDLESIDLTALSFRAGALDGMSLKHIDAARKGHEELERVELVAPAKDGHCDQYCNDYDGKRCKGYCRSYDVPAQGPPKS